MPFVPLHELCPDVASRETRTLTLMPGNTFALPPSDYQFCEMYCNEAGCDCRRVFFTVLSSTEREIQAIIAWGWEDAAFYARWLKDNDPRMVQELQGPVLNLGSPQSKNACTLLELAARVLLADAGYRERIKRHYALFRSKIDRGANDHRERARKMLLKGLPRW
jgi:hypothetical protein